MSLSTLIMRPSANLSRRAEGSSSQRSSEEAEACIRSVTEKGRLTSWIAATFVCSRGLDIFLTKFPLTSDFPHAILPE